MLGIALYGTTVLLPLMMQTLLGYTAQRAGEALSPGGFVIIVCMPIVGFLLARGDPRKMIAFGLVALSLAMLHMTSFNLNVDFRTVMLARCYQSLAWLFCSCPSTPRPTPFCRGKKTMPRPG